MSFSAPNLLSLKSDGPVAFLQLDDGRGNALGRPMLEALEKALAEAESANVLVLSGREKIFSGGLDLPALVGLDQAGIMDFMGLFNRVHSQLLAYRRPIITVARGSAVAGGAILLAAGDDRLCTPDGVVGVTEVALGVPFPTAALEIVLMGLGDRHGTDALASGRLYRGEERLRAGFATEVVPPDLIDARARELATERAKLDPGAVARVRLQLRRAAMERVARHAAADVELFIESWCTPGTQARIRAAVDRLTKK